MLSCILLGGIGNNLFQIATVLSFGKDSGKNNLFGRWNIFPNLKNIPKNIQKELMVLRKPMGGHLNMEINEIFPSIPWSDGDRISFEDRFSAVSESESQSRSDLRKLLRSIVIYSGSSTARSGVNASQLLHFEHSESKRREKVSGFGGRKGTGARCMALSGNSAPPSAQR